MGKEVALTSSNVWLSLLETPSWGWPPLPFLSLSLKHVPSKSPSLQTPPVEPSPDLLPRRPTFLRLATLKGPAQARTQIPPPCPPPVHMQAARNTQRRGWGQRPPAHTGSSSRSAADPGLPDEHRHSRALPRLPHAAPHRLGSTHGPQHTVLTDTHEHNHTRGLVVRPSQRQPTARCLPAAVPAATRGRRSAATQRRCPVHAAERVSPAPQWSPALPWVSALPRAAGPRGPAGPRLWTHAHAHDYVPHSSVHARPLSLELQLTVASSSSCAQQQIHGGPKHTQAGHA